MGLERCNKCDGTGKVDIYIAQTRTIKRGICPECGGAGKFIWDEKVVR
jgi:DnaJ-class molecular chaperone